ncbi:MAG: hypothetical protein WAP52_00695 [Candidatus Sungiibacteriota bacterium]
MREDNKGSQREGTVVEKEKDPEVLSSEKWLRFDSGSYYRIHPDDKRNEVFQIDDGSLTPMTYCINNDVIARVTEGKSIFVAPVGSIDEEALKAVGYTKSIFYVPLSHGEVPDNIGPKWKSMKSNADSRN